MISMFGLLVFQAPRVKSGTLMELDRLGTDHWLKGTMELHAAASYTSWSSGSPLRRQSISRQSMSRSVPTGAAPICRASSLNWMVISGVYLFSSALYSSGVTQAWSPTEILGG